LKAKPLEIPLVLQTAYAELLDRGASIHPGGDFAQKGSFVAKKLRGKRYWYFQDPTEQGRAQRYVGPETPALLERIERHKAAREIQHDQRTLVSILVRSTLPRPLPPVGDVVAALAEAGVFHQGGMLIGSLAYQAYAAMLGERLPAAPMQTNEMDIAWSVDTSVSADGTNPSIIDVLKRANPSFKPNPNSGNHKHVTTFKATGGLRVNFLTPISDPATNRPLTLPAFDVDTQPLRFLDFLIRDAVPAIVLHGTGVHVAVPAPERFALHKLIVARRPLFAAKSEHDIRQAGALLDSLVRKRPDAIRIAWQELYARGPAWRRRLGEGLGLVHPEIRERTLKLVGVARSIIPGIDLHFDTPSVGYDRERDAVILFGKAGTDSVRCAVSRAVLHARFGTDGLDRAGCLRTFREHRPTFERLARTKYVDGPIQEPGNVFITMDDIGQLRRSPKRTVAG